MTIETVNMIVLLLALRAKHGTALDSEDVTQIFIGGFTRNLGFDLGMPGLAVTVAWSTLALSGRWQPEPNWLDRAGRLVGSVWVVLMVFHPWLTSIFGGAWS
jgi:hypothetical protein